MGRMEAAWSINDGPRDMDRNALVLDPRLMEASENKPIFAILSAAGAATTERLAADGEAAFLDSGDVSVVIL